MTTVTLFEHNNFQGDHLTLESSKPDLRFYPIQPERTSGANWNDQVSSVRVLGGKAEFFGDANYNQDSSNVHDWSKVLGPDGPGVVEYPWLPDAGIPNDQLSSVRIPFGTIVELYQDRNFHGPHLTLYPPGDSNLTDNFIPVTWNDQVSSIKVANGSATFYEHIDYGGLLGGTGGTPIGGWSRTLVPGDYPSVASIPGWEQLFMGGNDQISSVWIS